jgi:hypothetical protein
MFPLHSREQCEEFQMTRFGISCATCDRSDDECPWHRCDDETGVQGEEHSLLVA